MPLLSGCAGDWAAAADAVGRIESWWRIPAPLAWMTEARHRMDGLDAAWPLLVELAWLAPKRFDALARSLADASLESSIRRPWLVSSARRSLQAPAERAMRLLLACSNWNGGVGTTT